MVEQMDKAKRERAKQKPQKRKRKWKNAFCVKSDIGADPLFSPLKAKSALTHTYQDA
jgi:hypothetical protein